MAKVLPRCANPRCDKRLTAAQARHGNRFCSMECVRQMGYHRRFNSIPVTKKGWQTYRRKADRHA